MKLIFATTNPEKLKEAKLALAPFGHQIVGESFPFIEPTKGTLEEIARIKLSQINSDIDAPIFVDDSGIFFEAYSDFPGILTRRIFDLIGYKGIDKLLMNENRQAYFKGVIALKWRNEIQIFSGITRGVIIDDIPKNVSEHMSFPFDPIFLPEGSNKVLGEMPIEERVRYSYRRKALERLGQWLNAYNSVMVD